MCRNLIKTFHSKFVLTNDGIWTRKVKENETACNAFWYCVEKAFSKNPKSATFLLCHSSANMWISEQINQPESNNHVWIQMQMWHFKLLGGLLNNSVSYCQTIYQPVWDGLWTCTAISGLLYTVCLNASLCNKNTARKQTLWSGLVVMLLNQQVIIISLFMKM